MPRFLEQLSRRARGAQSPRAERERLRGLAELETRSRALMSELCPHGWAAQITLYEVDDDQLPLFAGEEARGRVALDWAELEAGAPRAAVTRRVWAATIAQALEAMVADRRTDETLEQIERGAGVDRAVWPEA